MTKDSGVFGIPIPDDATRDPNSEFSPDRFLTSIATIQEVTAFYKDYMSSDGWIFDQEFSALEPSAAEDRKLGYITNAVYTKPTLPVTTVSIIIGNADGKPGHKRDLALYIIELPDEDLPRSVDDFLTGADRQLCIG